MRPEVVGLALWIALCFAAAGLGSIATARGLDGWYRDLAKPAWTPPGWLFAPVWTVLYLLMAVASWRVWLRVGLRSVVVGLFLAQLTLNVGWSWLFFGLRQPGWAVAEIALLWLSILATILAFWKTDRLASALLWPYLAWVGFASILNAAIWRMNR